MKPKPASLTPNEGIYRKLSVRMYGDAKFARLSPIAASGQSLFIYILTGPHTGPIPGVFVMGRAAMAEALNWDTADFDSALKEVTAVGMVEFDQRARLWFIPNALKHNLPHNPNVVLSWRSAWPLLPECDLRCRIERHFQTSLTGLSPAFGAAFTKVYADHSPNHSPNDSAGGSGIDPAGDSQGHSQAVGVNEPPKQEQEQEQEQQQEQHQQVVGTARQQPAKAKAAPAAEAAAKRGARLSPDFVLPKAWGEWAQAKYAHWTADTIRAIADKFRNHWVAKAGKDATKMDWFATWQNWCTSDITQRENPPPKTAATPADEEARRAASLAGARALIEGRGRVPGAVDVIDVSQQADPAVAMRMLGYENPLKPDTVFSYED